MSVCVISPLATSSIDDVEENAFQRVRLSATCNNVWMIHYNLPGIDPESVAATNTNATGFENGAAPTSRSYTFNVTVGF